MVSTVGVNVQAESDLKVELFGPLFGLYMKFDFSLLRVLLPLDQTFPAYQKLKRHKDRKQMLEKKAALRDVLLLERTKDYFAGGALDWRLSTAPVGGGAVGTRAFTAASSASTCPICPRNVGQSGSSRSKPG